MGFPAGRMEALVDNHKRLGLLQVKSRPLWAVRVMRRKIVEEIVRQVEKPFRTARVMKGKIRVEVMEVALRRQSESAVPGYLALYRQTSVVASGTQALKQRGGCTAWVKLVPENLADLMH
jgi:hypothetical protein